jgi:hypothetical protein
MAEGPGKYDNACTVARETTNAAAVILIVVGGELGHGFSIQGERGIVSRLPSMLREIASQIEKASDKGGNGGR